MFRIFFSSHGDRTFGKAPKNIQQEIVETLESLAQDKFWYRRVRKLEGSENRYRLRIARWRILFSVSGQELEVMDVFMKKGSEDYRRRM